MEKAFNTKFSLFGRAFIGEGRLLDSGHQGRTSLNKFSVPCLSVRAKFTNQ